MKRISNVLALAIATGLTVAGCSPFVTQVQEESVGPVLEAPSTEMEALPDPVTCIELWDRNFGKNRADLVTNPDQLIADLLKSASQASNTPGFEELGPSFKLVAEGYRIITDPTMAGDWAELEAVGRDVAAEHYALQNDLYYFCGWK